MQTETQMDEKKTRRSMVEDYLIMVFEFNGLEKRKETSLDADDSR